jgi:hypothetical protein
MDYRPGSLRKYMRTQEGRSRVVTMVGQGTKGAVNDYRSNCPVAPSSSTIAC